MSMKMALWTVDEALSSNYKVIRFILYGFNLIKCFHKNFCVFWECGDICHFKDASKNVHCPQKLEIAL